MGFPVYPVVQEQIGVWLITWHSAFGAHTPGQGSLHFWFKQAKWFAHSLLLTHSGRQLGGWPMKFGRQVHEGVSPLTWHMAFGPHGEGTQGFSSCATGGGAETKYTNNKLLLETLGSWKEKNNSMVKLTNRLTSRERISGITRQTRANWIMVDNLAFSTNAAGARTWISTFLIGTRFTELAVGINRTFWSTRWRRSDVSGYARTNS